MTSLIANIFAVVRDALKTKASTPTTTMRFDFGRDGAGSVLLKGVGEYNVPVVGEKSYQSELEEICGGRTYEGHHFETVAVVANDHGNPYDENAVAVFIGKHLVGYISRDMAPAFRRQIKAVNVGRHAVGCRACIVGGWDRDDDDWGYFGVKLDIAVPLQLETPE